MTTFVVYGVSLNIENYCTIKAVFLIRCHLFIKSLDATNQGGTVACRVCCFPDAQFLNLPVVQDFLMSFLIGLLTSVFPQRMCAFNSLFLPLAATQPVLIDIAAIRSISMLLMAVITARSIGKLMPLNKL